jgi:hypothetical protein
VLNHGGDEALVEGERAVARAATPEDTSVGTVSFKPMAYE